MNNKIINILYELKSPFGFLGMGYDRKSIPIIFEYLNSIDSDSFDGFNSVRYSSVGKYRKLENFSDFYQILPPSHHNSNIKINQKLYTDITTYDLHNSKNIFTIISAHDESIVDYISNNDISNFFFDKTLLFIKNNPSVKILFIDDKEGSHKYNFKFFESFRKFVIKSGISNSQLVFITNSVNIENDYQSYLQHNKLVKFMMVKIIPFLIYPNAGMCIDVYLSMNSEIIEDRNQFYSLPTIEDLDLLRNKYYMCLNRNSGRFHRPKLILELIKLNLFNKGNISLLKSSEFDMFCKLPLNVEYKKLIGDVYPFVVDVEDAELVSDMHNFFTKKDIWLDTYFSIVSETSVSEYSTFITEKTVRPMIYYHPFIVWGNPNTLSYLRSIGFETFPELFDESYDSVYNEKDRLNIILDNVNRLCNMDITEIHDLYQIVKPKLIHNRNLLLELYKSDKLYEDLIGI